MNRKMLGLCAVLLVGCSSLSDEEKALYTSECTKFVENNAPGRRGSGGFDMQVFDIYKKKDKWVVEVGYKRRADHGDTYSVRLCVVDPENGRLFLPSPLNDSEWRK